MTVLDTRYSAVVARANYNEFMDRNKDMWILLYVTDPKKLRFYANCQFTDANGDLVEFTIADETGKERIFSDADAAISWVNTTFNDLRMSIKIVVMGLLPTLSKVPTDAAAEAKRQLDYWTKQLVNVEKPIAKINQIKKDQEQLGWNLPTANIILRQKYNETVLRATIVLGNKDLFTSLKAEAQAIVNS